ncbi:Gfo/Idh/MocA family oxidoreductase [Nonomuraea sp. NPDC050310]|uniref:Gfo/Idh/MocA family protein n=1 Tax=unclassified Nonomuraea TaxID=2593643 RepID=UPI0033E1F68F
MEPISVGLIGAGPWAEDAHAPMLKAGPHTRLAGVWARRPEAAARLGAPVFERLDELFEHCEAVAFCVPPGVQAELAVRAARAGKALLLEKPLADTLDNAVRLAEVIGETGVPSQMMLTLRYAAPTREFLKQAGAVRPFGGNALVVGGLLRHGGAYATPWRLQRGVLLDVAPHSLDLMDAALGTITGVRARGNTLGWTGLLLEHEGGALSEMSLTMAAGTWTSRYAVFGAEGSAEFGGYDGDDPLDVIAAEFAETVRRGGGHPLDAQHGLHLQRIIDDAEKQLLT